MCIFEKARGAKHDDDDDAVRFNSPTDDHMFL
jgi:hypothetical protein